MGNRLSNIRIAVLATDGFEQSELMEPVAAFKSEGATVNILAPSPAEGKIRGWKDKDWGKDVSVDVELGLARASDYDALILPGGVINPDKLRTIPEAVDFVRDFFRSDKIVAAICHGPQTLIEADVVKGRLLTSWPSMKTDLRNAGAQWVDREAVVDGNLVTSRKPADIPAFIRETLALLEQVTAQSTF